MTDVHTHVLPNIDDGSNSIETSIFILRESMRQGVETVVATSHCYVKQESDIKDFIKKRSESFYRLMEALDKLNEPFPDIRLGCEVHLDRDISKYENLEELKIEGTDYILIEMPYSVWNTYLYDALYSMTLRKFRPIMAHIERFYVHLNDFSNLTDLDLIYQINAESFLNSSMKKVISYLFKNNMAQLIGSDTHNMDARPQKIAEAYKKIEKVYGLECSEYLKNNAQRVLDNEYIDFYSFKKLGFFERLRSK